MQILSSFAGMLLIASIAVALSHNRRAIRLRVVVPAFALQVGVAALVLRFPPGKVALEGAAHGVESLLGYARAGVTFLFGPLAAPEIGGHSFVISALPTIVFFASLISILYYLGVMQQVIRWIGARWRRSPGSAASRRYARRPISLSGRANRRWSSGPIWQGSRPHRCLP